MEHITNTTLITFRDLVLRKLVAERGRGRFAILPDD